DSVRPWRLRGPCPLRESSKERTEKQKQKVHGIYKKQKRHSFLREHEPRSRCEPKPQCNTTPCPPERLHPYLGGFSPTTPKRQKGIGEFFRLPPKDSEKQNRIPEETGSGGLGKAKRSSCPLPPDHTNDKKEQNFLTHP
ncbi:hypothetical protein FD754_008722, partial [Muntiacus muntjak]